MVENRTWVEVGGRALGLRNLDKVLWEEDGYTKGDLIRYLTQMAPYMLPHLRDRPLSLRRFPNGTRGKSFYQKQRLQGTPPWVEGYPHIAMGSGKQLNFILAHEPATLAWLGDQACVEIHPWLSRTQTPRNPDFAVIDLDPDPPSGFREAREVALVLGDALTHLGLKGYLKTSGVDGLHIYVPLAPGRYTHEDSVDFCLFLGGLLVEAMPERVTLERRVQNRRGRVYIDCYQNGMGKTVVAPYCPRPVPGAPVSLPVGWDEVKGVEARSFTMMNVHARIKETGDMFKPVLETPQEIAGVLALTRRKNRAQEERRTSTRKGRL